MIRVSQPESGHVYSPTQCKAYSDDEQLSRPASVAVEIAWAQQPTAEPSLVGMKFAGQVHVPLSTIVEASSSAESFTSEVLPPSIATSPVPTSTAASVEPDSPPRPMAVAQVP